MKRFKDCKLCCVAGQTPLALLGELKAACAVRGIEINRFDEKYNSLVVSFSAEGNPKSSLVLHANNYSNGVAIINIFPDISSGINELSIDSYNAILDAFKSCVFVPLSEKQGNKILENSPEYDIDEIIPISCKKLKIWLENYPLSGHTLDRNRWYDFVIAMYSNHESIDPFVFRDYLISVEDWSEVEAENAANKLEEQLSLLARFSAKD